MDTLRCIFRNGAFKKLLLVSSMALGVLGVLSGAWMAIHGEISSAAGGLGGGLVTFVIGYYGLWAINHPAQSTGSSGRNS